MDSESLEPVEVSPKGRYQRFSKLVRSVPNKQVFLGLDTETGKRINWHVIQVASLGKNEKERLVGQAEKLKGMKHPLVAGTLAAWNAKGREIVMITCQEKGDVLDSLPAAILNTRIRQWGLQLLIAIDFLQTNKMSPIDVSRSNVLLNEDGVVLFDVVFTQHLSNLRLDSELLEDLLLPEVDQVSFAMILLEVVLQDVRPLSLNEVLRDIQQGKAGKYIERVADERVREVVSRCLCPAATRWSVKQLMEHPFFKHSDDGDQESLSPMSALSPQASVGPSREDLCTIIEQLGGTYPDLPLSLIIDTDDVKLKVTFTFCVGKDSPEGIAEELLHELGASQTYMKETTAVIRRKLIEKGKKAEDLISFPQKFPLNPFLDTKDEEIEEVLQRQKEEEAKLQQKHERQRMALAKQNSDARLPRADQSCPSLIDIIPLIKPVKSGSDLKSMNDFERPASRKNTNKILSIPVSVFLKKGVENDAALVRQLQDALNLVLTEDLRVDGTFGKKTEHVVKKFQEMESLQVTGIVDSCTWAALMAEFSKHWKTDDRCHTDYIS